MIFYAVRKTGFLIVASFYGPFSIDVDILICRKKMCNINKEAKERQDFSWILLLWSTIKVQRFFFPKKKKELICTNNQI